MHRYQITVSAQLNKLWFLAHRSPVTAPGVYIARVVPPAGDSRRGRAVGMAGALPTGTGHHAGRVRDTVPRWADYITYKCSKCIRGAFRRAQRTSRGEDIS